MQEQEIELPSMFDDDYSPFNTNDVKTIVEEKNKEDNKNLETNIEISDILPDEKSIEKISDLNEDNSKDYIEETIQALIDEELENVEDEYKNDVLKTLLEGVNTEEGVKSTKEDLKKIINNISNLKGHLNLLEETSSYSDDIKKAIIYEKSGGTMSDYFKTLSQKYNITSLDIEKESDQEQIIRYFYRDNDILSSEEVDEKIEELKDLGLLQKEASKLKPKLDKKSAELADNIVKEQKLISDQKESLKKSTGLSLNKEMSSGFKGVKLTSDEINQITHDLLEEKEFTYGKNKQTKKVIEYLIDYNLYADKGDKKRSILAYMVLNPNFDKKIEKIFNTKEINKFIEDHQKESFSKFKNIKSEDTNQKFKFKINK